MMCTLACIAFDMLADLVECRHFFFVNVLCLGVGTERRVSQCGGVTDKSSFPTAAHPRFLRFFFYFPSWVLVPFVSFSSHFLSPHVHLCFCVRVVKFVFLCQIVQARLCGASKSPTPDKRRSFPCISTATGLQ